MLFYFLHSLLNLLSYLQSLWFLSGVYVSATSASSPRLLISLSLSLCICSCFSSLFTVCLLPNSVSVFSCSMCLDQSSMECCVSNVSHYIGQDFRIWLSLVLSFLILFFNLIIFTLLIFLSSFDDFVFLYTLWFFLFSWCMNIEVFSPRMFVPL